MAAHRARWYGEKLRTSASFVSPVNSHRCVLRLPFPPLFPLPLSLLFSKRAPRHRPPSRASPVRTRVHRVYIKPSPLSRPSRFAIMPRDRPASDRASCFATNDWTTQKTVAKSPISTFIELRCSTDSPPPPPPPPTFLPSSPRFLFCPLSPRLRPPSSNVDRVPTPHTTHPPRGSSVSAKGEAWPIGIGRKRSMSLKRERQLFPPPLSLYLRKLRN